MCTDWFARLPHGNWSLKQLNPVSSPHHRLHDGLGGGAGHSETKREELITGLDEWIWKWAAAIRMSVMEHLSLAACFQRHWSFILAARGDRLQLWVGGATLQPTWWPSVFIQEFNHANHEGYVHCCYQQRCAPRGSRKTCTKGGERGEKMMPLRNGIFQEQPPNLSVRCLMEQVKRKSRRVFSVFV